jgi:hypothetical protein
MLGEGLGTKKQTGKQTNTKRTGKKNFVRKKGQFEKVVTASQPIMVDWEWKTSCCGHK